MLGFQTDLQGDTQTSNEGLDTSNLEKHELYELVSSEILVCPMTSKGLTRAKLLQYHREEIVAIGVREYKHFELALTKAQQRKVGIVNNALLVRKLNLLLASKGMKPTGFTEFEVPDQCWLYKAARFLDPSNLLEFFEAPVSQEPPLTPQSSMISQIYFGRLYASKWLFRLQQARNNKKLWEALKTISENYRAYTSTKINCDLLEHELRQTREKLLMLEHTLNDLVGKAAFTYSSCENPQIKPELVIAGGDNFTNEMREQLNSNAKL